MFKFLKRKNTLYCFTPEVMLATFIVEIALAIYVFVRYRMTFFGKLAGITLIMLGLVQASEYQICAGLNNIFWARMGVIATALLPILGLHIILMMGGNTRIMKWLYAGGATMVAYFFWSSTAVTGATCGGNYIIFQSANTFYWIYGIYYLGFLFGGIYLAPKQATHLDKKERAKKIALYWMVAGYLSFILPMGAVFVFYDFAYKGMISIMCGFAVVFALLIGMRVVPLYHKVKSTRN